MINSNGGQESEVFRFFAYIEERGIKLTTVNLSQCHSAGISLFLCGETRLCPPTSLFMFHEPYMLHSATIREATEYIERAKRFQEIVYDFACQRCQIKREDWDSLHSHSVYFLLAQEALEKNIATGIGNISVPWSEEIIRITGRENIENYTPACINKLMIAENRI
jgi:ATP-dependent protease ClpP protease subunit